MFDMTISKIHFRNISAYTSSLLVAQWTIPTCLEGDLLGSAFLTYASKWVKLKIS